MSAAGARPATWVDRRRALVASCVANVVEWYDFAVFGALSGVLAAVLLGGTAPLVAAVLTGRGFGAAAPAYLTALAVAALVAVLRVPLPEQWTIAVENPGTPEVRNTRAG